LCHFLGKIEVMKVIVFLLLFPFNSIAQDALLQAIYGNWDKQDQAEEIEDEPSSFEEAEIYHWELGTPDNIPEIQIIYEESPCQL